MERNDYEKNLSTQSKKKKKESRLFKKDEHKSWKVGVEETASEIKKETKCLNTSIALGSLKDSWEFRRVYRAGKVLVSKNIVLYFYPNTEEANRIGFSISKKVGNSVKRHRIKRVYLEAFRHLQDMLSQGYDFVLVARKPSVNMNYHGAKEELLNLCGKGRLLKRY